MVKKKKKGPKLIPKPESPSRGRLSSTEDLFDGFTTSIQSTDNNVTTTGRRKNKATNLSIETSINTTPVYDNSNTTTGRIIPLSTPRDSNNDTTTPDIDGYDKFGLILNKKDSIDDTPRQGSTTQDNPSILQQTFPLRRHSSNSYMSDSSSTTSSEDNIHMLKDEDNTEHIFVKHRKGEISDDINESHYAPQRIRPSMETAESSITGNSLTPSAIESQSIGYHDQQSDSSVQHLMTSYQGRIHADASFSSSSDESDIDITQSHLIAQQQLPLPLSSQQQLIPPLQMRLRQPMSAPSQQQSSDDAERSRSNTSFIMSSDDDQNIKNELSVYSLSDKLRRISTGPVDQNTGRHPPIEGHRVDSVETIHSTTPTEVNSFYPNSQSMIESTSAEAAKPRAQHDTSFLKNIRENWALSGSLRSASPDLLHSPSGAFVKELNTEDMSSTPQDTTVQSLIYSDEDDNIRKLPSRPLLSAVVNDEETPLTTTLVQNEQSMQKVYISRYINILLISFLNMLNGWTCFSIAPISELVMKALDIQPESVVVLFLVANVCASFLVPPVLGRLGLRRTILLGSLLLMLGNMIKSSTSNTIPAWRIYVGFIISGLSGPFYQHSGSPYLMHTCFPKHEQVMANRIIMHSNQIGIGCSFVLSTQLVSESKDLHSYFHLLSVMSGIIFVGVSLCLSECPRTPPGGQDIVTRGTLERLIVTTNSANSQPNKNDWRKTRRAMNQNKDRSPESSLPYYYGSTDTSLATAEHNDNTSVKSSPFPNLKCGNGDTSLRAVSLDYSAYISGQLFRSIKDQLPSTDYNGVEPILIQTHRYLDIELCDNQMWRSIRACLTRVGFAQCVVSYASSGMTMTTLTTFMSYFITSSNENKATGQVLVGVVGGLFQLLSVVSSASASIRRNNTTQKSYMIILALLSITALILILCDLNLDSIERFGCNILMLALVVSPVQPLSSQLGVDVVSPISETTVLIIQQVCSSFLSVCCILACTALRRVSSTSDCLFYLLISIQVLSTTYFATFHRQYTNYIESKRTRTTGAFQPPSPPRYPKPRTPRDRPVLDEWKDKFPQLWKPKS